VFYPEGPTGKRVIDDIQVVNDMYSHLNLGLRLKFNKKPCDIETMAANADQITMKTNPEPLEDREDKVCFDVIFTVPANYFEREAVMNITPTFTYKGDQLELEPVTFVGEKGQGGDFKVNYVTGGEFTKQYCVDYKPELESAKLVGNPMFYIYNGTIYPTQDEIVKNTYFTQGGDRVITQGVLVPKECKVENLRITPKDNNLVITWVGNADSFDVYIDGKVVAEGLKGNTYTAENLEAAKYDVEVTPNCGDGLISNTTSASGSGEITPPREPIAIFYFEYQSATLKTKAKMNDIALKALAEQLLSGKEITGFEIEGWASPENADGNNAQLSADRAKAVEDAIKNQLKKMKLNDQNFTFEGTGFGSDFATFEELVAGSNIKDKKEILNVIKNAGSNAKKEQEVHTMKNVYNELEKDILPLIRRAEVFVK
jgi:outer membrane protein OmpA-like peptidoglycan-associated protein